MKNKILLLICVLFINCKNNIEKDEQISKTFTLKKEFINLKPNTIICFRKDSLSVIFKKIENDTIYYEYSGNIGNKYYKNIAKMPYYLFFIN